MHGPESVVTDHAAGTAEAVRHLHASGHERIGLLTQSEYPTGRYVRRGWRSALTSLGLPTDVVQVDGIRFDAPGREREMDDVIERCRRTGTTAVIVLPDPQAIALEQHCLDRGIRVPDDLAIVAYDDDVARFGDPAITAVRPPKQFVGREAVNLLIARLEAGSNRPAHRVKLSPELHVRDSSMRAGVDAVDLSRREAQITSPRVVPETGPCGENLGFGCAPERCSVREFHQKAVEEGNDGLHAGLLKHDLGNKNGIRITRCSPGEIPLFSCIPIEQGRMDAF